MTFLPIVERELRVRARSRGWHWMRFAVVAGASLVCVPGLLWGISGGPVETGKGVFTGLIAAGFLLCCVSCLLTADIISSERREGTLILLFLTRVKSFDVLLGKLTSAGLASFCALLACAPLLIIPVLAGGVTVGEAVRKSLVLMNTMFIALAAGIWASARGKEWFKSARTALVMVAVIVVLPGLFEVGLRLVGWIVLGICLLMIVAIWAASKNTLSARDSIAVVILSGFLITVPVIIATSARPAVPVKSDISLLSPLVALKYAGDVSYSVSQAEYWISLGLLQAASWGLLAAARVRLKNALRQENADIRRTGAAIPLAHGEQQAYAQPMGRGRRLKFPLVGYGNPIEWLLEGQRGIKAAVWAGAMVGFFQYGLLPIFSRLAGPGSLWMVVWPLGFAVTILQGTLFAAATSWFFINSRRSGELEMLLTTPVGAATILSTQWKWLKRVFQWPVAVMVAPIPIIGLFTAMNFRGYPAGSMGGYFLLQGILSSVDVVFGIGALCWLGLWFGLKARNPAGAVMWTVGLTKGVPFLVTIVLQMVMRALVYPYAFTGGGIAWMLLLLPQVLILWYYVKLIAWGRKQFAKEVAPAPVKGFRLNPSCELAMTDVK